MRQRTTFFHRPESPVDPTLIRVSSKGVSGPSIDAQREDRYKFDLDDLPPDLVQLLADDVTELYVRWVSPSGAGEAVSPLLSRASPGLHVFYSQKAEHLRASSDICSLIRSLFGSNIDCKSTALSSIALGTGTGTSPALTDYQFYSPTDNISAFVDHVEATACKGKTNGFCQISTSQLKTASSLDLAFHPDAGLFQVTVQQPFGLVPLSVDAVDAVDGVRVEVGVMAADAPRTLGPHEIGMAGHVAVLGQDTEAKPVLFAFASRHREAPNGASFSASFSEPTGLHPTLQLRVAAGAPPRRSEDGDRVCKLHTYLTLPRHIFADRYQLDDALFLASKNLASLVHMTEPVDLEAPVYTVDNWGSAALVELAPRAADSPSPSAEWTAEIPLHLRYLLPADGGYQDTTVPYPIVFWACDAPAHTPFGNNPFDRTNLGYDTLFAPTTEFWHLKPSVGVASRLELPVRVPVLDSARSQYVNVGTTAVILLGFTWVLWKLASVYLRIGYSKAQPAVEAAKKDQ